MGVGAGGDVEAMLLVSTTDAVRNGSRATAEVLHTELSPTRLRGTYPSAGAWD